jgi:hypothetical protein
MKTRIISAVVVGAVLSFFGGWLLWGMALSGFYSEQMLPGVEALNRAEEDMVMWALIIAQFAWSGLITWVIVRTNSLTFIKGLMTGGTVMFLLSLGVDLYFHSMMEMYKNLYIIIIDVISNTVFWAIIGGVIGWILGRGNQSV